MCRLFGFRSVIQSQVHHSLISAENALGAQSSKHPDGWGVSYYVNHSPHIIKSEKTALNDNLFKKVSGVVSSETVLAHIRNATLGKVNILNTHPFQYGHWTFAHNGNIQNFDQKKDELLQRIRPNLRRFILGDTDSEVIFYFLLSHLSTNIDLCERNVNILGLEKSIRESVSDLSEIIGPYCEDPQAGDTETYLTFILTNGETMLAYQGGKKLFYSTYKNSCSEKDNCSYYSPECENATKSGQVNHLVFSSEPLKGDNVWIPMNSGTVIGVDGDMNILITNK